MDAVVDGCLLHDVAHFDPTDSYQDHGRLGTQISQPFLLELGYLPAQVENIYYAIAVHVDGQADFEHPYTLEVSAVSDADNIDRLGAHRILQWCLPEMGDLPALADKLRQRIARLDGYLQDNPLEAAAGRALFEQQLKRQIAFFRALMDEEELTRLPEA